MQFRSILMLNLTFSTIFFVQRWKLNTQKAKLCCQTFPNLVKKYLKSYSRSMSNLKISLLKLYRILCYNFTIPREFSIKLVYIKYGNLLVQRNFPADLIETRWSKEWQSGLYWNWIRSFYLKPLWPFKGTYSIIYLYFFHLLVY